MEQESLNSINQIKKLIKEDGLEDKALYLRPSSVILKIKGLLHSVIYIWHFSN